MFNLVRDSVDEREVHCTVNWVSYLLPKINVIDVEIKKLMDQQQPERVLALDPNNALEPFFW